MAGLTAQADHGGRGSLAGGAVFLGDVVDRTANPCGIKYRYYLSSALLQGRAEQAGSLRRIPAVEIETLIVRTVREHLKICGEINARALVQTYIARVET